MELPNWTREFPGSITICDPDGRVLYMNDRSAQTFAADGGRDLVGSNVLDCHPEPARARLQKLLETGQKNVYTIEKAGIKKIIYQSPWYEDGQFRGMVELALEIPNQLPHFIRG